MSPEPVHKSFAAVFIVGFIICVSIIAIAYYVHLRFFAGPRVLPQGAFTSRLEKRHYWDEKLQKEIYYWVVATDNTSPIDYYSCTFDITSKGTQDLYRGFYRDYTVRDCFQYTYVKTNYDCRLENGWKYLTQFSQAVSLRKFPKTGATEISVGRHYLDHETRSNLSYL